MTIKKVLTSSKYPVKVWTNDIDVESENQLLNIANLPFIHKHVAAMPDVHLGQGATIGSVIATKGAIIPAAVGVDLGCGMLAVQTSLVASDLPDNLHSLRCDIEAAVPHGRTNHGGVGDKGGWLDVPSSVMLSWSTLENVYNKIINKHPKAKAYNTYSHLGTLGTGNHFIELCLDESQKVWIMLHSGSRGAGNKIGSYFIELAKKEAEKYFINNYLADKDTAYLVEHTELFDDYIEAVHWAQLYAELNRKIMLDSILATLHRHFKNFTVLNTAINCHHNYIAREHHFGANVIVTRKGAIRAKSTDLGIIPGSMGAKSYIVRGKGEADSFHSCSHGAGRAMGRREAERLFTVQDLIDQTKGIECPKDQARVDEIPAAYKDIDVVMDNQSDLVEVVHTLKQVLNVKG
jgi:tRNA-splicing ligase RtcB